MKPGRILAAAALVAIGLLIAITAGQCANTMGGFELLADWLSGAAVRKEIQGWSEFALIVATPFMALGLVLCIAGVVQLRRK
jgi:hypothetical protein